MSPYSPPTWSIPLLSLPGHLYGLSLSLRSLLYRRGCFRRARLPVPVISVGNLTVGGTGKTPLVQALARVLQEAGYHPAIASRGYGGPPIRGQGSASARVVSDGRSQCLPASEAGDEPTLLGSTLPGVPVVCHPIRRFAAERCIELGADLVILDDGFQHLALERDVDLLVADASVPFGNGRTLPAGPLRETLRALGRAHAVVLTRCSPSSRGGNEAPCPEEARNIFLQAARGNWDPSRQPLFASWFRFGPLRSLQEVQAPNLPGDLSTLRGRPIGAFCGIGNPNQFFSQLEESGLQVLERLSFRDHEPYSRTTLDQVAALAARPDLQALLTTEKDLVKLPRDLRLPIPILAPSLQFSPEDGSLEAFLLDRLRGLPGSPENGSSRPVQ